MKKIYEKSPQKKVKKNGIASRYELVSCNVKAVKIIILLIGINGNNENKWNE